MSIKVLNKSEKVFTTAPANPVIDSALKLKYNEIVKIGEDAEGNELFKTLIHGTTSTSRPYIKKAITALVEGFKFETISLNGSIMPPNDVHNYPLNYAEGNVALSTYTFNDDGFYGIYTHSDSMSFTNCEYLYEVVFVKKKI